MGLCYNTPEPTWRQVLTFESQLSQIEPVLFLKFSFAHGELWLACQKHVSLLTRISRSLKITTNINVVVKLNLHPQYSNSHETAPLLTCYVHASSFKRVLWHLQKSLAQVFLRNLLAQVTFMSNYHLCHRLNMCSNAETVVPIPETYSTKYTATIYENIPIYCI